MLAGRARATHFEHVYSRASRARQERAGCLGAASVLLRCCLSRKCFGAARVLRGKCLGVA
eukprot:11196023-Lingulodinium_polyedra.AAC.1